MNISRSCFLFLALIAAFQVQAQKLKTFPNDPIGLKHTTLANGLQVYLVEDHSRPNISGAVAVKAGGKYDPKDATGMGHYLEHMLFKGTQTMGTINYEKEKPFLKRVDSLYEVLGKTTDEDQRKQIQSKINVNSIAAAEFAVPNELDRLISSIGGKGLNAFTGEEMIVYLNSFPSNQIERWLDIYSHRFEAPVFRLFQSELETVYEEKNRAMDGFEYGIINKFNSSFYKVHPYGQQTIIGETAHLKNPSLTKMYEYYNTYYVANNMALILSGDFDAEKILPIIQKKFGDWRTGEIPAYPSYPEADFEGREHVMGRLTPIKAGMMGFRTCPNGHPDEPALMVANYLLSNSSETGLLQKLTLDDKIMISMMEELRYNDHGGSMVIFVPKIVGQSFKKAEALVIGEIEKIGAGEFDETDLKTAKLNLVLNFQKELESNTERGRMVLNAFIQERSWDEYISLPDRLNKVTKEEVIAIGKKYYGKNYMVLESKMGFPKKEKLEKPGYKAPKPPKDAQSAYAKALQNVPEGKPAPRFIDFKKDLTMLNIGDEVKLYHVPNPINDIFELRISLNVGTYAQPSLLEATQLLSQTGIKGKTPSEVKEAFQALGCQYLIVTNPFNTSITLTGLEENFEPAVKLLSTLCFEPIPKQEKLKVIGKQMKTNRKLEGSSAAEIGMMAKEYAAYGQNSRYLHRTPSKEVAKSDVNVLIDQFQAAINSSSRVFFSGNISPKIVQNVVAKGFWKTPATIVKTPNAGPPRVKHQEDIVYFIPQKNAIQTQIHFMKAGRSLSETPVWLSRCFNEYMGGMSGLVFQEIREFRSLAYSASAALVWPLLKNENTIFKGYIGCQADKTLEAISVMEGLIREMPAKPDRIESLKKSALQSTSMRRPGFRRIGLTVARWEKLGLSDDPNKATVNQYQNLTWELLFDFYKKQIQQNPSPLVWVVSGDPKRFDPKALEKYGKVIPLKTEDFITK